METDCFTKEGFTDGTTFVATKNQISCALSDEAVILSFEDATYYGLNPVGAAIWQLAQKPITLKELREALTHEFDVEAGRCENDLRSFLENLCERKLLAVVEG